MRNHELLIFMLGVLAASATLWALTDISRKALFFQVVFFLAIATQLSTQGLQFSNAHLTRPELDRHAAFALYAYTEDDKVLLNTVARDEPYLIGYRYFRDGYQYHRQAIDPKLDAGTRAAAEKQAEQDFAAATQKFDDSIERGEFVAQSHYLMADIIRIAPNIDDVTPAEKHLDAAIKWDREYSAPYYLRAILEVEHNEKAAALNDLKSATMYGTVECFDINNPTEDERVWKPIAALPAFLKLQQDCKTRYPEILKDAFARPQTQE
jgi:hypothetical protein